MITERQKKFLTYFLTRTSFLGITYSLVMSNSHQDSWISCIAGYLIGLIIISIIKKTMNKKEGKTINEYLKEQSYGVILRILLILFSIFFIIQTMMILSNFIASFFLLNTPHFYILLPFLLLTIYICFKGINNIAKTSEAVFPIAIIIPIIIIINLFRYYDVSYLQPIFSTKINNIIYSSFLFGLLSSMPYLFLLNIKNNGKGLIKNYTLNCLALLIIITSIICVLGRNLVSINRFPEYIVLKRIKVFSFIEKVENILSLIWVVDEFIALALSSYTIYELVPHNNKIVFSIIEILIYLITSFYIGKSFIVTLNIYHNILIPYIIFTILIMPTLIFYINKKDG